MAESNPVEVGVIGCGAIAQLVHLPLLAESPDKKIVVMPCSKCNSIDICSGIVIADTGLTDIY